MSFEVDPKDGLPTFVPVNVEGLEITCTEDVYTFWKGLYEVGKLASSKAGYTVYPIYEFEETN